MPETKPESHHKSLEGIKDQRNGKKTERGAAQWCGGSHCCLIGRALRVPASGFLSLSNSMLVRLIGVSKFTLRVSMAACLICLWEYRAFCPVAAKITDRWNEKEFNHSTSKT